MNLRKEYFSLNLEVILGAVEKHHGKIEYIAEPEALEYHETQEIALRIWWSWKRISWRWESILRTRTMSESSHYTWSVDWDIFAISTTGGIWGEGNL